MDSTEPTLGGIVGGKYLVERKLGEGGMGAVYAARNVVTGKQVALKWMHARLAQNPDASQRFLREAQASARVRHPNVVDVYDVVSEDGVLFMVMELLEGEALSAMLDREGTPLPLVISLLVGAMRGVAAAHREGIIHRDIKPDNIFMARVAEQLHPVPKVLDFGISKVTDCAMDITDTGTAVGTPLYMSIEQLSGVKDIDARTDVYAFGVVLYQIVTGVPPYAADSFPEMIAKIMTEAPVDAKELRPDVPTSLVQIIRSAMAKDRNQRTPNLETLIVELEPFMNEGDFMAQMTIRRASIPLASTPSTRPVTPLRTRPLPSGARQQTPRVPSARPPAAALADTEAAEPSAVVAEPSHYEIPRPRSAPRRIIIGVVALLLGTTLVLWLGARDRVEDLHQAQPATAPTIVAPPSSKIPELPAAALPTPATPEPVTPTPEAATVARQPTPPTSQPTHAAGHSVRPIRRETSPISNASAPTPVTPTPEPAPTGDRFRAGKPSRSEF